MFLVVALVVGRLAATARDQAAEAERRAMLASAREREAMILAQAASALLAGEDVETQLERSARRAVRRRPRSRAGLTAAPAAEPGELAVRIPLDPSRLALRKTTTPAGIAEASSASRRRWHA